MSKTNPKPGRPFLLTRDATIERCNVWPANASPLFGYGRWEMGGEAIEPVDFFSPTDFEQLFPGHLLPPGGGPKRVRIVMMDDD